MNLSFECVTSTERLDELHNEWNALLLRSESKHFALTHEWLSSWWKSFGDGKNLNVLTVRRDGELVCVAPLMESVVRQPDRGPFGIALKRLGSLDNVYTPLCDFISAADGLPAIGLVWEHLLRNSDAWDFCEVLPTPMLSQPLLELERMARAAGFRVGLRELSPSPFAHTSNTWQSYLYGKTSRQRNDWRRTERKAAEKGDVSVLSIAELQNLERYLSVAFQIERSGWKGRAGTAILQDPQACTFYTSFAHAAARNGWLLLQFLLVDSEPVAFVYDVVFEGFRFCQKVGYLETWSSVAPGKLIWKRIVESCFDAKVQRYDFLSPPAPLKLEFATGQERRFRLRIYNRNPKGFILVAVDCILVPLFKKLQALGRSRSLAELGKRLVTAFRNNVFDLEANLVHEKDLGSIEPVSPKLPGVSFEVAEADEVYSLATDPEYMFSREEALQIPEFSREGDVCIVGRIEKKVVFYQWVQFKRHMLSEGRTLNLGGQKPFIFRWGTTSKYRGKSIFPAGLTHTYDCLKSRGIRKCYVDVSGRDISSIRGIEKTGAKLIGRFRIVSIFRKKRAFVPKRLLERISVSPHWCS